MVRGFSPMISPPALAIAPISPSRNCRPHGLPRRKPRSPRRMNSGLTPKASLRVTRWMVLRMSESRIASRLSTNRDSSSVSKPCSRAHRPT